MRDIFFKSSISVQTKKRDLFIRETIERDGVLAKTERRCLYFILGKVHVKDQADIEKLSALKLANLPHRKKHYYILKTHDTNLGQDKLLCKVAGTFYVVCGSEIYCIAFIHSFKVTFELAKEGL